MLNQFEKYLEEKGYSIKTPSGKPSTCNDYSQRRIPAILQREGINLKDLILNIDVIINRYDNFGSESEFGSKSNRAYINALKRFREFLSENN